MADRLFAGALFVVALGFVWIAFTEIRAPIQYDPLGPESWPRLLGIVALICLGVVFAQPQVSSLRVERGALPRLAATLALLIAYALLFRPLGFVPATWAFSAALTFMLGARTVPAMLFGGVVSIFVYVLCVHVLELTLPAGPLVRWIGG